MSLSVIMVEGEGYADEIITKSLSRFASGGLVSTFLRGSIFSIVPLLPSSLLCLTSKLS